MKFESIVSLLLFVVLIESKKVPKFAPYIDVTREDEFNLVKLKKQYGVNSVSLSFALGGLKGECEPTWAGQLPIEYKNIIDEIRAYIDIGGDVIVSTGGAAGPYLENSCQSAADLAKAYNKVLALCHSNHIDIDIESTVPSDMMNEALATLQKKIPNLTVSFTLGVMGDDYGINVQLGIDNILNAIKHGLTIDIINPMTMEFSTRLASWGDAVIGAAEATVKQMKSVWPEKSEQELYSMLGVTPMIGKNMNGKIFEPKHAQQLVDWAKTKNIGQLAFWSIGRDKACPNRPVGPDCSSIEQHDFEFTKIFAKFDDPNYKPPKPMTTRAPTTTPTTLPTTIVPVTEKLTTRGNTSDKTTKRYVTQSAVKTTDKTQTNSPKDCSKPGTTYPHEFDCNQYYVCVNGEAQPEICGTGTIWDITKQVCNFPKDAKRPECVKSFK